MSDTPKTRAPLPILIALSAATLTGSLGISIATVLLPALTRSFDATVSEVQWVLLAYLMALTIAIVSAGRLGDLLGHRRVLIAGLAIFIAASVLCAAAPSLGALIAGRGLQGLGGAILLALSMSLARDLVPAARLGSAMGLIAATTAIGTALGPSLGGVLLAWCGWRMAFWLLAGVGAFTFGIAAAALPRETGRASTVSLADLDVPGSLVLGVALAAYALATSHGILDLPIPTTGLIAIAAVAAVMFAIVESRVATPLVPLALLRDATIGLGFLMNLIVGAIMMSTLVVGPFFLAFSLGLNEALVGLVMAVGPAIAAISGIPAGRLTDRFGTQRVCVFGLLQMILALVCLAALPRFFGVGGYVAALFALTPSFQLFLAANTTAVLADASREERGRVAGLLGLSRNLGLMTGASAIPAVFVGILGTGDVARAPIQGIAHAFSMTFAATAGLAAITLGIAILRQMGGRSPQPLRKNRAAESERVPHLAEERRRPKRL
ncbi:MAG: MFS transporter [Pseudomonadota bacterium]